ncbi:hypothetical protein N8T08_006651 [Aspergillus melleus]|uniref:Uncharacterized protein n=1 Tax=Aspergillus melleus TaxID=138277 RepID=A0ACC3BFE0_9EURO|nr:hypothetical protein N8T08_006651 [Aspergillus melleus]
MDNSEPLRSLDIPRPLAPDSLSCVAEDASTLAAAQEQEQQPQSIQGHATSANVVDAHSLPPLHLTPSRDGVAASLQERHQTETENDVSIFASKENGYLRDMMSVLDPPDLDLWRERLFNVDETLVLSEEQFRTYFPHVDNVYSHRSTQHYKRRPLVSHYWDCRLKGRPPGTPKSDDPNKKKRKRTARQRDLCDVKIKITEYFPAYGEMIGPDAIAHGLETPTLSSESLPGVNTLYPSRGHLGVEQSSSQDNQPFGVLTPNPPLPEGHPGANGQRFFTVQRVNGNGANGKNDGVGGGHRHSLEESDRVKKNSVQRYLLKEAKEQKKATARTMSTPNQQSQRTYHTKATGQAAVTAAEHAGDHELKLYGSCFCPFVQRVWIALEAKGIPYQYIEVDPYQKPPELLELEDLNVGPPLLQGNAQLRAHCRLWTDFINRHVVPNFYRLLQEQNDQKQILNAQELKDALATLVSAANPEGPFFLGLNLSFVDVQIAPWVLRLSRALKPYRGWPDPEAGSRWATWVNAIEDNEHIKATVSTNELYLDSYERYAQNRPNTSQLANAINSGRGLP